MNHQKKSEQKKSFMYDHITEVHSGCIPPVTLEIVERLINEPGVRQAAESVLIREERPPLNGKDEWTNLSRKQRELKVTSDTVTTSDNVGSSTSR